MHRTILLLGAIASASAFSASRMGLRSSPTARSVSRSGATCVKMDASLVIASAPGLVALGLSLANGNKMGGAAVQLPPPVSASPSVTPAVMLATARTNFQTWNDALQTKNHKTVANLYSTNDLSFLPTVSPQHIKALPNAEDYFKDFVLKNPFGTITDDKVQVFDDGNTYLHSGMYTFELGDAGARTPVEARFSYVWRKEEGNWKIAHHHSSVTPAPASPSVTPADMLATARTNFQTWNDSLQTKNLKTVANLYSKALPNTEDKFKDFVLKNPFGTITDDKVKVFNAGNTYLHSGMYVFEWDDAGARTPADASFSYVWRKEEGNWKIVHFASDLYMSLDMFSMAPPVSAHEIFQIGYK